MATLAAFLRNLEQVDIIQTASDSLKQNQTELRNMNIKQLMSGINNKGTQLSPKYSEDPYFKTAKAALAYARWKKKLFPETPFDVPNLIINGYTHNSLVVQVDRNEIKFQFGVKWASELDAKYQNTELGLSPDSKNKAYNVMVQPSIVREICLRTGAKATKK